MADLGARGMCISFQSNSFHLHAVLAKIMPNNRLAVSLAPPLGNPGVALLSTEKVTKTLYKTLSGVRVLGWGNEGFRVFVI